jgi:high frequency lysogenization protein
MSIKIRTLAFAGMYQCAELVRQVARHGLFDQAEFEVCIKSVLKLDADSVEEIYGGVAGVKMGLRMLCGQISSVNKAQNTEVLRYMLGMIVLEHKLMKQPNMLDYIRSGIEAIQAQVEIYGVSHPEVITELAKLYTETLSTFDHSQRIKVNGERRFLENQSNADKIRALLLAGVRSTVLWQQKGGGWLQLVFRKKMIKTAEHILETL